MQDKTSAILWPATAMMSRMERRELGILVEIGWRAGGDGGDDWGDWLRQGLYRL